MELLIGKKSRYAAAVLVDGYCGNVENAFKEAEGMLSGKWNPLSLEEKYYLLYNPEWYCPYVVKIQEGNVPDPVRDGNMRRYRW